MDKPYAWHPKIVDVQMLKIGQFIIAAVPGEFTTMSGRRLKDALAKSAKDAGVPDAKVTSTATLYLVVNFIFSPK